jgi:hypothetical protein
MLMRPEQQLLRSLDCDNHLRDSGGPRLCAGLLHVRRLFTYVHTSIPPLILAWSTGAIRGLTEPHLQKGFPVEQ